MSDFGDVTKVEVGGFNDLVRGRRGSKERVESRIKPILRARGEEVMEVESVESETGPLLLRVDLVLMRKRSILSLLSLRKL